MPDFMVTATTSYRIVTDHLGSVRLVVNAGTGDVVQRLEYDEFGNVILDTNPGFQPFGYAGGLYDAQTGLVRFGARDYDAETGRWTAKEPLKFADGTNFYVYSQNNPINFIDPNGRYAAIFDLENKRIYGVITERGETLWGLAKNITGEGSRWTEIDACGKDPRNIHIGDSFDVTGLFAPSLVSKLFRQMPQNDVTGIERVFEVLAGGEIASLGVGLMGAGISAGVLSGGAFWVAVGGAIVVVGIDVIEGNGADITQEILDDLIN